MTWLTETARTDLLELAQHLHPEVADEPEAALFSLLVDLTATYNEVADCALDTTLLAVRENLAAHN